MKEFLNIIHLADLHFGKDIDGGKVNMEQVVDGLVAKLDNLDDEYKIDFIVISGDIGFSGKRGNYKVNGNELTAASFLSSIRQVTEAEIIVCAGNHDRLCRGFKKFDKKNYSKAAKSYETNKSSLERIENSSNIRDRKKYLNDFTSGKFKEYIEFCKSCGLDRLDNAYIGENYLSGNRYFRKKDIGFLVLNTAWLSDPRWNDKGRLAIGRKLVEKQLEELCEKETSIILTVAHHSPYWLEWGERYSVGNRDSIVNQIVSRTEAILVGHEHSTIYPPDDLNKQCLLFVTGSAYESPSNNDDYYFNSFEQLKIDLQNHTIERLVYGFSPSNTTSFSWNSISEPETYAFKSKYALRKKRDRRAMNFERWNQLLFRSSSTMDPSNPMMTSSTGHNHHYIKYLADNKKFVISQINQKLKDQKAIIHVCFSPESRNAFKEISTLMETEITYNRVHLELY